MGGEGKAGTIFCEKGLDTSPEIWYKKDMDAQGCEDRGDFVGEAKAGGVRGVVEGVGVGAVAGVVVGGVLVQRELDTRPSELRDSLAFGKREFS